MTARFPHDPLQPLSLLTEPATDAALDSHSDVLARLVVPDPVDEQYGDQPELDTAAALLEEELLDGSGVARSELPDLAGRLAGTWNPGCGADKGGHEDHSTASVDITASPLLAKFLAELDALESQIPTLSEWLERRL